MSGPFHLARSAAARVYATAVQWRNRRFDQGRGISRIDRSVISVGNLSMGGTGKTPMVRWIVEHLTTMGAHPAVLTRGYGARSGGEADEVLEYRDANPDLAIFVGGDRVAVLRRELPSHPEVDCIVMDDGFQHRSLHRDLDLVLVSAHESLDPGAVIPAGRLREPPVSLQRADAVIVTGSRTIDGALAARIEALHGQPPIAWCSHAWSSLTIIEADAVREVEIDWLHRRRIVVRLGIGSPETVRSQLRVLGAVIANERPARDHQPFTQAEATFLSDVLDADAILMTAKDWVKARDVLDLHRLQVPVVVPRLELRFLEGEAALGQLIRDAVAGTGDGNLLDTI
ncbi:MAG: tetraacyldisaccharide 4'-kinase [Planctomycetota bacterium]|nr:tetraacyldisaccharide 4'-kinase [Planctomycetota bacterium]